MRLFTYLIVISMFLPIHLTQAMASSGKIATADAIQPFGSLKWEDSVLDTILKAKKMGAKSITTTNWSCNYEDVFQDLSAVSNNSDLASALNELTQKMKQLCNVNEFELGINFSPIVIEGYPHSLSVLFVNNPNLRIVNPSAGISVGGDNVYYVMTRNTIESTSSISTQYYDKIKTIYTTKYSKFINKKNTSDTIRNGNSPLFQMSIKDSTGNDLYVAMTLEGSRFVYGGTYNDVINNKANSLSREQLKSKYKNNPDLGSGL